MISLNGITILLHFPVIVTELCLNLLNFQQYKCKEDALIHAFFLTYILNSILWLITLMILFCNFWAHYSYYEAQCNLLKLIYKNNAKLLELALIKLMKVERMKWESMKSKFALLGVYSSILMKCQQLKIYVYFSSPHLHLFLSYLNCSFYIWIKLLNIFLFIVLLSDWHFISFVPVKNYFIT